MAEVSAREKYGVTPGKLALIGVLAVVLITTIVLQFGGGEEASRAGEAPAEAHGSSAGAEPRPSGIAARAEARTAETQNANAWPTASAREAVAYDPFALSPALALRLIPPDPSASAIVAVDPDEDVKAARQAAAESMLSQGVGLVFESERGPVATIGPRVVHVGDLIDGFRVVAIGPQGVILRPHDPRDSQGGRP